MISLQNYDEYLVRYLDGECSPQEIAAVALFLMKHPDLNAELNALKATVLSADEKIFLPRKELLKKGITMANYEEYMLRKIEGDLARGESGEVESFMDEHPELQREMNAFTSARLVSDLSVVFPDKNSLKKRDGKVAVMYVRYALAIAVAACLMLIIMIKGMQWNDTVFDVANATVSAAQPEVLDPNKSDNQFSYQSLEEDKKLPVYSSEPENRGVQKSLANKGNSGSHSYNQNADINHDHDAESSSFYNDPDKKLVTGDDQMTRVEHKIQMINYRPAFRKAPYRKPPALPPAQYASRNNKQGSKLTTVAAALGSELLRLSGREDFLKTISSFNDEISEKKKLPVALTIKGNKFSFYHKFFKKRNQSSAQPKQN
ncbi:MAG: hypothetical protein ABIQ74_13465 [Chitinophagales bacterium]